MSIEIANENSTTLVKHVEVKVTSMNEGFAAAYGNSLNQKLEQVEFEYIAETCDMNIKSFTFEVVVV